MAGIERGEPSPAGSRAGELQPGDLVAERFRVEALLGEGGIARVYKVRHVRLGSTHALKILHLLRPALADRLLQEGRIQAQLQHENLVRVTDVVEHRGQPCLVMEYVEGTNLQELLARRGALPLDEALALFAGVLSAVTAAHDHQVLHRDLKPANILLAPQGRGFRPKVSDFGVAKIISGGLREGETQAGVTMGTPGYMAPEQIEDSSAVDHRADIFALGAILYEMLSGQRPFAEDTTYKTLRATIAGRLRPLSALRPELPPAIVALVHRCLAVEIEDRFPDGHALAQALQAARPELDWGSERTEEVTASTLQGPERARPAPPLPPPADSPPPTAGPSPVIAPAVAPGPAPETLVAPPASRPTFDPAALSPAAEGRAVGRIDIQPGTMPGEDPRPARSRRALPWPLLAGLGIGAAALVIGIGRLTAPTRDPVVEVPTPVLAGEAVSLPVEPGPAPGEPPAAPLTASPPPTGPPATTAISSTSTMTGAPPPATGAPTGRAAASAPETSTAPTAQPTAQETTSAASHPPAPAEGLSPTPAEATPPDEPLTVVIVQDEPATATEVEPPSPAAPVLLGTWTGAAGGQPLKVQILSQDEESVSGIFVLGGDEDSQAARFRGRIEAGSRRIRLVELGGAGRSLQGQLAGEGMTGTLEGTDEGELGFSLQRR